MGQRKRCVESWEEDCTGIFTMETNLFVKFHRRNGKTIRRILGIDLQTRERIYSHRYSIFFENRKRMLDRTDAQPLRRGYGSGLCSSKNHDRDAIETHFSRTSLINLHDAADVEDRERNVSVIRGRSPSLPPIYTRESEITLHQLQPPAKQFEVEQGSRYQEAVHTRLNYRNNYLVKNNSRRDRYGSPREELEGETSGYASDSAEVPLPVVGDLLPNCNPPGTAMSESDLRKINNYDGFATPDNSLPPSRRLSVARGFAEVRPRWGSLWGQDLVRGDPPPPSWLERGLSRMDHTSQVLVINHESASSPESSTTGSAGSDSNKTYLRGQNVPLDESIMHERESKRQKALELQNAIKDQLEERERRRKEEKQRRLMEERAEEDRIKREQKEEKQRFEEEQRRHKEKEDAKHKKLEAMRQVLEAAERLAKEEKQSRRRRNDVKSLENDEQRGVDAEKSPSLAQQKTCRISTSDLNLDEIPVGKSTSPENSERYIKGGNAGCSAQSDNEFDHETAMPTNNPDTTHNNIAQIPLSTEIAIVLSGRVYDPEILNASNLQVNLIVAPSPTKSQSLSNSVSTGETVLPILTSRAVATDVSQDRNLDTKVSRLLTPSKYRSTLGREFGTQTDVEDLRDNVFSYKESSTKERKESLNANRRDIEKSTSTGVPEELCMKTMSRSKAQSRKSLETRPRWNANRPGTRYRTQSEKDPHYQRRLRLRRRQIDTSDDGSRSPSPERRKPNNSKFKGRNASRRKIKLDSYDADLSMDSLNSIVPLKVDKNGRINIENNKNDGKIKQQTTEMGVGEERIKEGDENLITWCGREILSQLTTLRNGLAMKRKEWDSQRCLVSPTTEFF
ncbi:zinc finger CCCH domain-containing protein 13 [Athalia rosae]|uniref:zinc finger CCCH domain-containing protein 13 n=1 Tax=Athalia rosae TaxID=37344 RepID=UPI0020339CB0|nr:zinc finger CCCH domain-containing protein 13 [Athalia rosae]